MRPPATIKLWLTSRKMFDWLQNAPDEDACKRRLAIWLTYSDKLHSREVAKTLGVSIQAVRLWISQYNKSGPGGLERTGRGGRRRALLCLKEEIEFLKPFIRKARSNNPPKAIEIKYKIEQKLGKKVSTAYIYNLLRRHHWSRIIAQSKGNQTVVTADANSFKELTQPWRKNQH
jgi:transposase